MRNTNYRHLLTDTILILRLHFILVLLISRSSSLISSIFRQGKVKDPQLYGFSPSFLFFFFSLSRAHLGCPHLRMDVLTWLVSIVKVQEFIGICRLMVDGYLCSFSFRSTCTRVSRYAILLLCSVVNFIIGEKIFDMCEFFAW